MKIVQIAVVPQGSQAQWFTIVALGSDGRIFTYNMPHQEKTYEWNEIATPKRPDARCTPVASRRVAERVEDEPVDFGE